MVNFQHQGQDLMCDIMSAATCHLPSMSHLKSTTTAMTTAVMTTMATTTMATSPVLDRLQPPSSSSSRLCQRRNALGDIHAWTTMSEPRKESNFSPKPPKHRRNALPDVLAEINQESLQELLAANKGRC